MSEQTDCLLCSNSGYGFSYPGFCSCERGKEERARLSGNGRHDGETAQARLSAKPTAQEPAAPRPLNMTWAALNELEKHLFRQPAILAAVYYDENDDDGIGDVFFKFAPVIVRSTEEFKSKLAQFPEFVAGALTGHDGERQAYERQGYFLYDADGRQFDTQTGEWKEV